MNSFGIDLGINVQKSNINVIEESHNKDQYYRIVYRVNGKSLGIYEAAKMNMSYDEWKEFKARKEVTWLPVPEGEYGDNNRSYFTKEGWTIFKKKTLPILEKYLKGGHIETSVNDEVPGTIVYKDRYQVVVSTNTILEGANNMNKIYISKYGFISEEEYMRLNNVVINEDATDFDLTDEEQKEMDFIENEVHKWAQDARKTGR